MQPSNFILYLVSPVPSIVMGNYDDGPLKALYIINSFAGSQLLIHSLLCLKFLPIHLGPSAGELSKWNSPFSENCDTGEQKDNLPSMLGSYFVCFPLQTVCLFSVTRHPCKIKSAFLPAASRPFLQRVF